MWRALPLEKKAGSGQIARTALRGDGNSSSAMGAYWGPDRPNASHGPISVLMVY